MRGLQSAIRAARTQLEAYASERYDAELGADVRGLQQATRAAKAELSRYAGGSYDATLGADDSEAQRRARSATDAARDFARQVYEATLDADPSDVRTAIRIAESLGSNFARQAFVASIELRGVTQAIAEFKELDREADKLDGRNVNLDVGGGTAGIRSLSDSFKGLASNIRATGTVLAAASIPFTIAGIGAAVPSVLALTASLGGLTTALGSGLVGAAVAATGAVGAFGGALGLVAAPVSMLLGTLKEYDQQVKSSSSATDAAKQASQSFADTQRSEAAARQNLAQVAEDSARQIAQAEQGVKDVREEGAKNIAEQERALTQTRRDGAASVRQEENTLAQMRVDGVESVEDQERQLAETKRQADENERQQIQALAQARRDARRAEADQEQALRDAERQATENNKQAADDLRSAREQLSSSTRSLVSAQQELNRAEADEPLRQEQATLDLASARDRASDAARAAAEAIATYGRHSEEATDALREERQANLDLETTSREVRRTRREGSSELQSAQEQAKSAHEQEKSAIEEVDKAEKNRIRTRKEGTRGVKEQAQQLVRVQKDSNRAIEQQQEALDAARREGVRQVAEQKRLLDQTTQDVKRSLREQRRTITHAQTQARRDEKEQLRALAEAKDEANQQEKDAIEALAETRRQAARQEQAAQQQLTDAMRATRRAAEALAKAEKSVHTQTVKLAPAQKALYNEYQRFRNIAQKAFRPAQDAAAGLGIQILRLAEDYLPRLGATSARIFGSLGEVFQTFREELSQPVTQSGISRYLQLLPRFTKVAGDAAVRLGFALFNVFTRSLKYVMPLTREIDRLTGKFLDFTQSARGRNQIDQFFQTAVDTALRLKQVVIDLGGGIVNVFDSINRSGLSGQALRGLEDLARGFRHITSRGTESRNALDRFMRDARDLMPHVGSAALEVARQIGRVASAAIGAREKGHRLTILESIFRGIQRAAKPMADLVIGTFENLGPQIAKLIPRLSRFFKVFAGASGPLTAVAKVLNRALRIFNNLPGPVKTALANLAALKILLGATGASSLIGGLGRLAGGLLGARGAAKKLAGGAVLGAVGGGGVVGGLGALAALLAGGIGLAALAGSLYLVYKRNKLVRDAVNRLADNLAHKLSPNVKHAKDLFENFGKGVSGRIDDLGDAIVGAFDLRRKNKERRLKQFGRSGAEAYINGVRIKARSMDPDGSPGDEIGRKIAHQIGLGIRHFLLRDGGGAGGLPGFSARRWVELITPAGMANQFSKFFGRVIGPEILRTVGWRAIGTFFGNKIRDIVKYLPGGTWWQEQTNKHIIKPIGNAFKHHSWGELGRDAALGIVKGFTGVDIGALIQGHIGEALGFVRRNNDGNSPWGSTAKLGKDAAQGFALGFKNTNIGRWLADKVKDAKRVLSRAISDSGFAQSGKNAALGFIKGFQGTDIGSFLVKKIRDALNWVKRYQKEGSPSRLWESRGYNAGLGYARGIDKANREIERSARGMADSAHKGFASQQRRLDARTRREQRTVLREAAKRGAEMAARYNEVLARARDRGATPRQLRDVAEARDKALLKNRRDAERQIASIRKNAAREEKRLSEQRFRQETQHARQRQREGSGRGTHRRGMVQAEDGSWVPRSFYDASRRRRGSRDDGFRANSRRDPNAHRPGYVQAEDGSWVPRSFYNSSGTRERDRLDRLAAARAENEARLRRLRDTTRTARVLQQNAAAGARSPESPGGRHITASEMRQVLKEDRRDLMRVMRAAAALSHNEDFFRYFDSVASKDFEHRTSMKADPR